MFPSNPSPQSSGNPEEEEAEGVWGLRQWRTPGEHGPLNQLSKATTNSQSVKQQAQVIHRFASGSLCMYSNFQLGTSVGLQKRLIRGSLILVPSIVTLSLLLICFVQLWGDDACFALFYFLSETLLRQKIKKKKTIMVYSCKARSRGWNVQTWNSNSENSGTYPKDANGKLRDSLLPVLLIKNGQ